MRHEFSRHCVRLGSALAIGLATLAATAAAQQADAPPKQKALIRFKADLFNRWKKEDSAVSPAEPAVPEATDAAQPAAGATGPSATAEPAEATPPIASPSHTATPLPPTSLVAGSSHVAQSHAWPAAAAPAIMPQPMAIQPMAAQPIATTLPPGAAPAQLTAGQVPLPAGQMPFATTQSPVIIMMPAGWQPDGSYTFAPRSVMSPEVPAEHWPTSQRNPFGDDSKKGLFNWPQIAKKITNETLGEAETARRPAPQQPSSKALLATSPAPAPAEQPSAAAEQSTSKALFAPASQPVAPSVQPAAEATSTPKALFGPRPKQEEPQAEQSKSRALLALLSKPMGKPQSGANKTPSKALFAFGGKDTDPTAAPAPAVVPQYAAETPVLPQQQPAEQRVEPTTTVESIDPEFQPPAPPSVSNSQPQAVQTVTSDNPKMKWRTKGASVTSAVASDASPDNDRPQVTTAAAQADEPAPIVPASAAEGTAQGQSATREPVAVQHDGATSEHVHLQHSQPAGPPASQTASRERSLLGTWFPSVSTQMSRNGGDGRDPWRRQAERDAVVAAEKKTERQEPESKAIVPNVVALFPQLKMPQQPAQPHTRPEVTTVSATEDAEAPTHSVRRAHASGRSTDSYYADPWEQEVEAELNELERRQMGPTASQRRPAMAQRAVQNRSRQEELPRVAFEADELEQEKSRLRRSTRTPRPPAPEPVAKKSYRRLTGEDIKHGFTRPLEALSELTKLPAPLKSAMNSTDSLEPKAVYSAGDEASRYEFYDEAPPQTEPAKPTTRKRQPVRELRQATSAAAHSGELLEREPLASDAEAAPRSGAAGRRRQVEPSGRTGRPRTRVAEPAVSFEAHADDSDEPEVRRAVHVRNKRGNEVLIYSGGGPAND